METYKIKEDFSSFIFYILQKIKNYDIIIYKNKGGIL